MIDNIWLILIFGNFYKYIYYFNELEKVNIRLYNKDIFYIYIYMYVNMYLYW